MSSASMLLCKIYVKLLEYSLTFSKSNRNVTFNEGCFKRYDAAKINYACKKYITHQQNLILSQDCNPRTQNRSEIFHPENAPSCTTRIYCPWCCWCPSICRTRVLVILFYSYIFTYVHYISNQSSLVSSNFCHCQNFRAHTHQCNDHE